MNGQRDLDGDDVRGSQDGGKDLLEDFSDGLEALMAVPVWFLSTWVMRYKAERVLGQNQESSLSDEAPRADQAYHCQLALRGLI